MSKSIMKQFSQIDPLVIKAMSENLDSEEKDRAGLLERIKALEGALKLALGALGGLTKPLYQQGASQNDVVNSIKRRDRDIHAAIEAIKACGVE